MLELIRGQGVEKISQQEYASIFSIFGGSLLMDPTFILKLEEIANIKTTYYAKYINNKPTFAIPTWGDYLAGDRKALKKTGLSRYVDLGRPTIIIPSDNKNPFSCKFKTNYLIKSTLVNNATTIKNRYIALFKGNDKDGISTKFKRDLRRYWKHFEKNNGTIKNIQQLHTSEISIIFRNLHKKRWGVYPPANYYLEETFKTLKEFLFGYILYLDNCPVSIQITYLSQNKLYTNVEYINSGMDIIKSTNNINLGNLLIDLNTSRAEKISQKNKTELIYSFGLYNVPYKERWCNGENLHKVGIL